MNDRRIHAETRHFQIVRYERAGKWCVESKDKHLPSIHISVSEAARRAVDGREVLDGTIYLDVPGGQVFDRKVRALLSEVAA
jgi:hypothetical protein